MDVAPKFPGADELRPYIGCWVAIYDGKVIAVDTDPGFLVAKLRVNKMEAHGMFRVPDANELRKIGRAV